MNVSFSIGLLVTTLALGACSDLADECAKASVTPGAACNNDNLECPYTLQQPNCDGTFTPVSTSCVCQQSAWSCPSANVCEGGP